MIKLPVLYDTLDTPKRRAVRKEYKIHQNCCCFHCGQPLDGPPSEEVQNKWIKESLFPEGFFKHPEHLHHDHNTGYTLGVVHARCNADLWQYYGE